jgi:hypothetical protein
MISRDFVRGRFTYALRTARSLLGGAGETEPSPRGPYVQGVTASSAVICWVGGGPGTGVVEYDKTREPGHREADARVGRRHAVTLTDLDPGSTYHHRVEGVSRSSATDCFRTAPVDDDSSVSFAVIGDSGSRGKGQLAVAALLERLRSDLILHTGDVWSIRQARSATKTNASSCRAATPSRQSRSSGPR